MSKYYDATCDEVLSEVNSDQYYGLSKEQVKAAAKRDGKNIVYPIPKGFFREYLVHMLTDYTSVLLLIAAAVCLLFRHDMTAIVVAGTILVSYSLCAVVFMRAQKVLENMGSFALPVVKVMREGRLFMARSEQIVRGDIIFLCAGDVVPADIRLLESECLLIDESAIACALDARKDASFVSASAQEVSGQKNMAFATTVVLSGSAKGVVVTTGGNTVVCKMHKNFPVVSHEKLRVLERLRKVCGYVGIGMLLFVFLVTALSLFLGTGQGLFENLLTFLSLAVSSMSELYMAFGYIVVACGIFSALRQYKNINAGALIKNSSKLDRIRSVSCIMAPRDGCFLVDELFVDQIFYDDVLYGLNDPKLPSGCGKILEYAVISTGIYGGRNLVSINSAQNNIFSTEENAIISCAQELSLYNFNLDKEYPYLDHVGADEFNPYDTTLVRANGASLVVVRGDAISLISRCTHRRLNGESFVLSGAQTNDLLLAANRMSIGGYRVCAIATKETSVLDLSGLSRAQARLTFEGFLLFKQTLLPDAAKSVRSCLDAGIQVIMFTDTVSEGNRYAARSLGVIKTDDEILNGKMFGEMDDGVFVADHKRYSLYEGFTVTQKRKAVHLLKLAGESVAYLGSAVDEAPILADADVGYCQSVTLSAKADKGGVDTLDKNIPVLLKSARDGIGRGCDALKIKSDVIVSAADKAGGGGFNAIVKSICVAKSVYENLFHMISYLICAQVARLVLALISSFTGLFLFSPAQIVVSGLIVDFAAVLVFAFDKPRVGILGDAVGYDAKLAYPVKYLLPSLLFALGWAIVTSIVCTIGMLLNLPCEAFVFESFMLSQLAVLAQFRCDGSVFRSRKGFNNVFAFVAVCVFAFLFVITQIPVAGLRFGVPYAEVTGMALCAVPALLLFVAFEVFKYIVSRKDRANASVDHTSVFSLSRRKKRKMSKSETEEYTKHSFTVDDTNEIEYLEEVPLEQQSDSLLDSETERQLIRLSVQCALTEWDPAGLGNIEGYDGSVDSISNVIRTDSSREVIATVLIATLSAEGLSSVRFDDCMACADRILEYMKLE